LYTQEVQRLSSHAPFINKQRHWVRIVITWSTVKYKVLSVGEKKINNDFEM